MGDSTVPFLIPLLGLGLSIAWKALQPKAATPALPGPTDAEVVASDLRLRRRLGAERGGASTLVSGGLAGTSARLTMPSLVGV